MDQTAVATDPEHFKEILRKQLILARLEKYAPDLFGGAAVGTAAGAAIQTALDSPNLSLISVQNETANLLNTVSQDYPEVTVQVTESTNNSISFISSSYPDLFQQAQVYGNNALIVIQERFPDVFSTIMSDDIFSNLYAEMPSALELRGGAEIAGTLTSVTNNINRAVHSSLPNGIQSEVVGIGQDIAHIAGSAGSTIASAAPIIADTATTAVSTVTDVAQNVVGAGEIASAVSVALHAIGSAVAIFPFLAPVQIALRDLGLAIQNAVFNRDSARLLTQRCAECSMMVTQMAPKIDKISDDVSERERLLQPLVTAINECSEYLKKFTRRGFLMHILTNRQNAHELSLLDKKVSNAIQNLSILLNGKQMDLQVASSEKLDEVLKLVNEKIGNEVDIKSMNPEILAEIAKQAGCSSAEAMKDELIGLGLSFEQIDQAVHKVTTVVNKVDKKVDNITGKIDEIAFKLDSTLRAQNERDQKLLTAQREFEQELSRRTSFALRLFEQMATAAAASQTGVASRHIYSTKFQSEKLSAKAREITSLGLNIIEITPYGIGTSRKNLNGTKGPDGGAGRAGKNGRDGSLPYQLSDGTDGTDGDDGDDGDFGEEGEDGIPADDFELRIELESEDMIEFQRTFRIEHAGVEGKKEFSLTIDVRNTVFFVNGKGGKGGKGGNGGRGGAGGKGGNGGRGTQGRVDQEGGNGGSGGCGGNGGSGGLGGKGGNGANGATVTVHTNFPEVFAILEVDVSGGEAGEPGMGGASGPGGDGGVGGEGGEGGMCSDSVTGSSNPRRERAGRRGKDGKDGKAGKTVKSIKNKDSTAGTIGSVSFNVYGENGLLESTGTPFRIVLNGKDMGMSMYPKSLVNGVECKEDLLLFGQYLSYGPIVPVNCGGMKAPPSTLIGELDCPVPNHPVHMKASSRVTYPTIPAETKTHYGELDASYSQSIHLSIPRISDTGFTLQGVEWPWVDNASSAAVVLSTFRTSIAVSEFPIRSSSSDGDHVTEKIYDVVVSAPIQLIPLSSAGHACMVPLSIEIVDGMSFVVSFSIENKSTTASINLTGYKATLYVASQSFQPVITSQSLSSVIDSSFQRLRKGDDLYYFVSGSASLKSIEPLRILQFDYLVTLPSKNALSIDESIKPGTFLSFRCELSCDDVVFEYCAPSHVRLAHPRPLTNPSSITLADVLFFSYPTMTSEDYRSVRNLLQALNFTAHFMDYHHFKDQISGRLPVSFWQAFQGRSIVVWAPYGLGQETIISVEALHEHVRKGGGLVCGDSARISTPTDWDGANKLRNTVTRRVLYTTASLQLTKLKQDLNIIDVLTAQAASTPNMMVSPKISGDVAITLAKNIICSMSTVQKLVYMERNLSIITELIFGDYMLNYYQSVEESSWFSSNVKVLPVGLSPCTLLDVLLLAIKTDLCLDILTFEKFQDYSLCQSIQQFLEFTKHHLQPRDGTGLKIVSYLSALAVSSDLTNDKLLSGQPNIQWNTLCRPSIMSVITSCFNICQKSKFDYKSLGLRIGEATILKGGYTARVFRNVIDLSNGSYMHVSTP